jgi:arsenate reductase
MCKVILFTSTRNAARSILAEALVNDLGGGHLKAYSAGLRPAENPDSLALEALKYFKVPSNGFASKGLDLFANHSAPLDFVISVDVLGAREPYPSWPGEPIQRHWVVDDPSLVPGPREVRLRAYVQTAKVLRDKVQVFAASVLNTSARRLGRGLRSARDMGS